MVEIKNDAIIKSQEKIKLHFTYNNNNNLSLADFSDCLSLVNKAINDINRKNGASNLNISGKYASIVDSVESGSVIVYILTNVVAPVALSIIANAIYDRLKTIGTRKEKSGMITPAKFPVAISVDTSGPIKEINIQIING